jgi:hypothetical protein
LLSATNTGGRESDCFCPTSFWTTTLLGSDVGVGIDVGVDVGVGIVGEEVTGSDFGSGSGVGVLAGASAAVCPTEPETSSVVTGGWESPPQLTVSKINIVLISSIPKLLFVMCSTFQYLKT